MTISDKNFDFFTLDERLQKLAELPAGHARGKELERLTAQIFESIPGIKVALRNVISEHRDGEIDLLLTNRNVQSSLLTPFGTDIIVECKSSKDPLDAAGVQRLAHHTETRRLPWAILIALNGITGLGKDRAEAAQQAVRDAYTRQQCGIVLLVASELREIRSARHLVNVLDDKRLNLVGKLGASVLDRSTLRALDPNAGFQRGREGLERAIRETRNNALREIFEAAPDRGSVEREEPIDRAAQALAALASEVERQQQDPGSDPLWQAARALVIDVGASFLALVPEPLESQEAQRFVRYEVNASAAPRPLRASPGSELWTLLTEYHLRQAQGPDWQRRESAFAVVAMAIDSIISIDDIDIADLYDD